MARRCGGARGNSGGEITKVEVLGGEAGDDWRRGGRGRRGGGIVMQGSDHWISVLLSHA